MGQSVACRMCPLGVMEGVRIMASKAKGKGKAKGTVALTARTIDECYRLSLTCPLHRYWFAWTVSNLGYDTPSRAVMDDPDRWRKWAAGAWQWVESAEYELGEGAISEEMLFCRSAVA